MLTSTLQFKLEQMKRKSNPYTYNTYKCQQIIKNHITNNPPPLTKKETEEYLTILKENKYNPPLEEENPTKTKEKKDKYIQLIETFNYLTALQPQNKTLQKIQEYNNQNQHLTTTILQNTQKDNPLLKQTLQQLNHIIDQYLAKYEKLLNTTEENQPLTTQQLNEENTQ